MMRNRKLWIVGGVIFLLLVLAGALARSRGDRVTYLTSTVQKGEIRDAVDATGTVNAVITVQVGSQVSGIIAKLNADFNSRVHKGDVVALIDPALLRGALLQATANLETAKANVAAADAAVTKANAMVVQTKADYERAVPLAHAGIMTQADLDAATANYASARATAAGAVANVAQAKAQVAQNEAAVQVAQTNLDYTVIRSPIDGIVVARNVDVGQTVAASLQAPTIFTIAQDLTKMQLYAAVDESDVGRITHGEQVTFKVDAFPKERFTGVVSQIRMNPTMVQNVVTYNAIIDFANPDMKLFPGMTAYVNIPVATATDVLKLPNAALRYIPIVPAEVLHDLYARYAIEQDSLVASGAGAAGAGASGSTAAPRAQASSRGIVWKLRDNTIEPVQVQLGITDHAYTEVTRVLHGELKQGDEVVTTSIAAKASAPAAPGIRR